MDAAMLFQFWAVAALLTLTPGADWAYAISAGLRSRTVLPSVLGIASGYSLVILAIALGAGALLAEAPQVMALITVAGGAYLLYLGLKALRTRTHGVSAAEIELSGSLPGQFMRGMGVSLLNPKGILLLVALLPQFIGAGHWSPSAQILALGGIHIADILVIYSAVALSARKLLTGRPQAAAVVTKVSGAVMVVLGAGLIAEHFLG